MPEHRREVVHRVGVERRRGRHAHRAVRLLEARPGSSCARTGPARGSRTRRGTRTCAERLPVGEAERRTTWPSAGRARRGSPCESRTLSSGQPVSRSASMRLLDLLLGEQLLLPQGADEGVLHGGSLPAAPGVPARRGRRTRARDRPRRPVLETPRRRVALDVLVERRAARRALAPQPLLADAGEARRLEGAQWRPGGRSALPEPRMQPRRGVLLSQPTKFEL